MAQGPSAVSPDANLTIEQAVGDGMLVKSRSLVLGAALAAAATIRLSAFPTFDDNKLRFIIGFFPNPLTTGLTVATYKQWADYVREGWCGIVSATHGPMGVYVPIAPNVQLVLEIDNYQYRFADTYSE